MKECGEEFFRVALALMFGLNVGTIKLAYPFADVRSRTDVAAANVLTFYYQGNVDVFQANTIGANNLLVWCRTHSFLEVKGRDVISSGIRGIHCGVNILLVGQRLRTQSRTHMVSSKLSSAAISWYSVPEFGNLRPPPLDPPERRIEQAFPGTAHHTSPFQRSKGRP